MQHTFKNDINAHTQMVVESSVMKANREETCETVVQGIPDKITLHALQILRSKSNDISTRQGIDLSFGQDQACPRQLAHAARSYTMRVERCLVVKLITISNAPSSPSAWPGKRLPRFKIRMFVTGEVMTLLTGQAKAKGVFLEDI